MNIYTKIRGKKVRIYKGAISILKIDNDIVKKVRIYNGAISIKIINLVKNPQDNTFAF